MSTWLTPYSSSVSSVRSAAPARRRRGPRRRRWCVCSRDRYFRTTLSRSRHEIVPRRIRSPGLRARANTCARSTSPVNYSGEWWLVSRTSSYRVRLSSAADRPRAPSSVVRGVQGDRIPAGMVDPRAGGRGQVAAERRKARQLRCRGPRVVIRAPEAQVRRRWSCCGRNDRAARRCCRHHVAGSATQLNGHRNACRLAETRPMVGHRRYAAVGGPNQVVSASGSPRLV